MSILDVKDRIPTNVLSNDAIRYGVYDEEGKLLRYEYMKREDEPIEEGDKINKVFFDNFQTRAIGYNEVSSYEDEFLEYADGTEIMYKAEYFTGFIVSHACKSFENGNFLLVYKKKVSSSSYPICYKIVSQTGVNRRGEVELIGLTKESDIQIKMALLKNGNMFLAYENDAANSVQFYVINPESAVVAGVYTVATSHTSGNGIDVMTLDNGNVVIFEGYSSAIRYYVYDETGNKIKNGTIATGNVVSKVPSATMLKNGNIFLAFQTNSNSGSYCILDQEMNVVKATTTFESVSENNNYALAHNIDVVTLKNGNVMIFYNTERYQYTHFMIVDEQGNKVVNSTALAEDAYCYGIKGVVCENGNVAVVYQSNNSSKYGRYAIISEAGEILHNDLDVYPSYSSYVGKTDIELLKDGNAVILSTYTTDNGHNFFNIRNTGEKYYKRNFEIEGNGVPLKNQVLNVAYKEIDFATQVGSGMNGYIKRVLLDNGNILVVHSEKTTGASVGNLKYKITNPKGESLLENLVEENAIVNYMNAGKIKDGNVIITYQNGADNTGWYVVVDEEGNIVKEKTQYATKPIYVRIASFGNGDTVIFYDGNHNGNEGYICILDGEFNIKVPETRLSASGYYNAREAISLDNGNVMLITPVNAGNSDRAIIDSDGNVLSQAQTARYERMYYPRAKKMKDGNILLAYCNPSGLAISYYMVIDQEGNIIKERVNFMGASSSEYDILECDNDTILICFREQIYKPTPSGVHESMLLGTFVALDSEYNMLNDGKTFPYTTVRSTLASISTFINLEGEMIAGYITTGGDEYVEIIKNPFTVWNEITEKHIKGIKSEIKEEGLYNLLYNGQVLERITKAVTGFVRNTSSSTAAISVQLDFHPDFVITYITGGTVSVIITKDMLSGNNYMKEDGFVVSTNNTGVSYIAVRL